MVDRATGGVRDADDGRGTIAYVTSGIFGYLYRFFPVARELRRRGWRVVVLSTSAEAVEHARGEGLVAVHLSQQDAAWASVSSAAWSSPLTPILRRIPGVSLGPRGAARPEWSARAAIIGDTDELTAALVDAGATLVVTEAEEHRDIRAAIGSGYRVVLFEDLYSTRPGADVPFPARSHQVPDGSLTSRIRARLRWERFILVEAARRRAERWWVGGDDLNSALDRLGAGGAGDGLTIDHRYLQFHDYVDLPRIRTVAPELAFPGEPQPPTIVGPIVDPDRQVHDVESGFEERWVAALERRRAGARIVYVSLGTFLSGLVDLTRTVIDGCLAVDATEVVVSVGRDRERWERAVSDDRVAVFGRVPQMRVLADTDVVVSTGGLNTGHEALWFGVPVLNLPIAGLDTPGNAARLVYHGVGRRLLASEISAATIAVEVGELLADPAYRERAAEFGEILRSRDATAAAADVIEASIPPR